MVIGSFLFCPWRTDADPMTNIQLRVNQVVSKWLSTCNQIEDKIFDEKFRDDDDMSPFGVVSMADDEENTY